MNKKTLRFILACLVVVLLAGVLTVGAIVPYTSYTYNKSGTMQQSPHAYVPLRIVNSKTILDSVQEDGGASDNAKILYATSGIFTGLDSPQDIFVDDLNQIYIANTGKNQVVILDENYNLRLVLSTFTNQFGVPDSFNGPCGIYVSHDEIYVADTENSRIVIFDKLGNFVDIVPEPESEVFPDNHIYKPIAVAVDRAGRVYVVSRTGNYGVISLNRDGSFNGFIGPQKVAYNAFQYFLRMFQTKEQLASQVQNVSTEFNNLTIDSEGFLYVTQNSVDEALRASAAKVKDSQYHPVKKLNPNGSDIMNRNGFFPPSGEVDNEPYGPTTDFPIRGASSIVDVALGPDNTWSIIDTKRSRVYTYDSNGNLLFAFGDKGNQLGNIANLVAIDYQGTNMLLLDRSKNSFTVYKRTDYGNLLAKAIQVTEAKQYEKSVGYFVSILQRNNNYDAAYVGIGDSLYRSGDYIQAMQNYKYASAYTEYSEAYKMYRKEWMEKYLWVVPVVVFLVIFGVMKFFKFANKVNKKGVKSEGKRSFGSEILYGFHLIFHPFDGFWDLKHEKRGSARGATLWLLITALAFVYNTAGRGYLADPSEGGGSYYFAATSIIMPVLLWSLGNWCLTTLFDGEGTLKDVYIATCYSLIPLPLLMVPSVMLTNVMSNDELDIVSMLYSIGIFWFVLLVFFGMMVTHDYTLGKNVLTTLGSIIGVAFIVFVTALFSALVLKVYTFIHNIYVELLYRWS
ncbi:MAG: YIP1 family protein [Clostridia bacterium]|nr:YIP1 family protein [Clostridia bacterium]